MLSGSWRKAAVPPAGSRGSSVLVEAQYDYEYRATDGKMVSIREGERFVLLCKSTEDWWQVRRLGDPPKAKPFYVPATYVTEVASTVKLVPRTTLSPCSQSHCTGSKAFCRSMEDLNSNSTFRSGGGARFPTLPLQDPHTGHQGSSFLLLPSRSDAPITRSRSSSVLPQNPYREVTEQGPCQPKQKSYSQGDILNEEPSQKHILELVTQSYIPRHSLQESPLYSNQEKLKRMQTLPPSPTQRPLQVLDLWEQHMDPASGRCFYVNSVTRERSWKPPRQARDRTSARNSSEASPGSYIYSVHDGDSAWELMQNIQRTASIDGLNTAPFSPSQAQIRNSSILHNADRLSHARSMILTELSNKVIHHRRNMSYHIPSRGMELSSPNGSADSSESSTPELEKCGLLNKTKIAEGGRKLRKNWNPSWVVLVGNSLMFFKDPKSQTLQSWKPGNSKPESSVDLRGAQLRWANDMSSKKNVFRLRTVTGNEFLLQSDTDSVTREWFNTIHDVIEKLDRDNPLDNVLLYSLRRSGSMEMLDGSGDEEEEEEEGRSGRKSSLPRSTSNVENSEKKRVKSRLRKLIQKRPPLQTLQEKGLIKDQVFGCRLDALCEREKTTVPKFVRLCVEAVERRGLETDGIYRVSGNLSVIQRLRFIVDHERAVTTDGRYLFPEELVQEEKLNLDHSQWEDIHVITGALKLFFRELPEPLVPYSFFDEFVETVKMSDNAEKVAKLKLLVENLPPANHDTMKYMFRHLKRVNERSDLNRMSPQNISIVFGPTLMRPEKDFANIAINMVYQNQVVEDILSECDTIFGQGRDYL
ncbi:rho GTPase-activating protein 15-like isoform X1 [Acipenser ruthenus]|uniref:rho GTPase-activating protein 15-like isoform X1 n=1 Tax=Acipenser ruthenus TaxID=7906 RepID=UPI002740578B|nr:rho GTPase-activating protein 15-like isoform X1 [Acipenser ruthenus]XP_058869198.1 rho GTPase-activating protein 15-like isoform X1 [Acipenser ruthenus]